MALEAQACAALKIQRHRGKKGTILSAWITRKPGLRAVPVPDHPVGLLAANGRFVVIAATQRDAQDDRDKQKRQDASRRGGLCVHDFDLFDDDRAASEGGGCRHGK
jgi:hypothetical protein